MSKRSINLKVSDDAYIRINLHALMRGCSASDIFEEFAMTLNEYSVFRTGEGPPAKPTRGRETSWVYFIYDRANDLMKIGYSVSPESRLKELQTGNEHELTLVAKMRGTRSAEAAVHKNFAGQRRNGEWFEPDGRLVSYIDQYASVVNQQCFDGLVLLHTSGN